MTATLPHREPPRLLPPRHSRRSRFQAFAAIARDADRPWSIAVDALVLAGFFALLCWETWEGALDGEWEHLAAAVVVLVAGVFYAFRAFTTTD